MVRVQDRRGCSSFENLGRAEVEEAEAGEIVAVVGLESVEIGDTICHREHRRPCRDCGSTSRRWK